MLVHDNARLNFPALKTRLDKIHLRFDRGQIVLCAALQYEVGPEGCDVRYLRHIEPDILWQDCRQPRHDLLRLPTLSLKINDVRLHKDGATVTEGWHRLRAKGNIGVIFNLHPEAFSR